MGTVEDRSRDSGPGISAKDYTIPGTGLGLSLCQEIVDKLGGRITVESDGVPGHGTAFMVWLKPAD